MGTGSAAAAGRKRQKQRPQLRPKKAIGKNKIKEKKKKKKSSSNNAKNNPNKNDSEAAAVKKIESVVIERPTVSQQLDFFVEQYQSGNGVQLSSLERDSLKETCIIEQDPGNGNLIEHVKVSFGSSWKKVLCEKHLQEGQVDPGSPAVLVISAAALRSLELLREFRSLTSDCHAAKLFSKHMKIEEQVTVLKNRVNIASGTPSRIKKLIDVEALGLSRLAVVVLDMHTDVKGYSLFTLPQVSDEFWDLYRSYIHQPLLEGKLRLCLYGPITSNSRAKKRKPKDA